MAIATAKPAPLALGVTEKKDGANRVELLPKAAPKPSALVDQLLEDFARSVAKPAPVANSRMTAAAAAPAPKPVPMLRPAAPNEADELRSQMHALERRLQSLEHRQEPRQEDVMHRRVLAVLEQLSAEIREHLESA